MSDGSIDFDSALQEALDAIDIGPHCSCAEITMEILSAAIPLRTPALRCAAAGFGGGVAGNGSVCGAFAAGLIAFGMVVAERDKPQGCATELIEADVEAYYDQWMDAHHSIYCADLSGYPSLRDQQVKDEFFAGGGPERCTRSYIRFAVEKMLELIAARQSTA
jgi:C_GCAxxG_C_C family probable redox protein